MGTSGQSFGAFAVKGVLLELEGDSQEMAGYGYNIKQRFDGWILAPMILNYFEYRLVVHFELLNYDEMSARIILARA